MESYKVVSPSGTTVMYSQVCRYNRQTEQSLMKAGYKIYIDGKLLKQREVQNGTN